MPPSQELPVASKCRDTTGSPTIRICETTESNPPTNTPPAATTATRSIILRGTPPAEMTKRPLTEPADYHANDEPQDKMILDKQRKLLIYLGEDGQKKAFHVEDFVGLYPAWPIVEVAIAPTGNAKE
jgi:hypothetical protein